MQQRMSVSVQFNGNKFLSSKEASRVFGYSSDYIARLARQHKIIATRIGHQWFVEPTSLGKFLVESSEETSTRLKKLSVERKLERANFQDTATLSHAPTLENSLKNVSQIKSAHLLSSAIVFAGFLIASIPYISIPSYSSLESRFQSANITLKQTAFGLHESISGSKFAPAELGFSQTGAVYTGAVSASAASEDTMNGITAPEDFSATRLNGLVVFPDTATASETIAKIEKSFSDKVIVKEDSNNPHAGTIVPVFKNQKPTEEYRYVIVPVEDPP